MLLTVPLQHPYNQPGTGYYPGLTELNNHPSASPLENLPWSLKLSNLTSHTTGGPADACWQQLHSLPATAWLNVSKTMASGCTNIHYFLKTSPLKFLHIHFHGTSEHAPLGRKVSWRSIHADRRGILHWDLHVHWIQDSWETSGYGRCNHIASNPSWKIVDTILEYLVSAIP